jgi:hypothetical protein
MLGEQLPLPANMFEGLSVPVPVPDRIGTNRDSRFRGEYDFSNAVPTKKQIQAKCTKTWLEILNIVGATGTGDECGLLQRPPPYLDPNEPSRTTHWALPVQYDTGTTSYVDAQKRLKHALKWARKGVDSDLDMYFIVVGDMQTFQRDWWYIFLHPDEFPNVVPFAGALPWSHGPLRTLTVTLTLTFRVLHIKP